ncbi:MAG: hypothetical protein AAF327_01835 [Cyanobacteria bacterium P01_A01_bin.37]
MNLVFLEKRLKDLEDNIEAEYELLKEYEDALRYATNPPDKVRYKREITKIQESANHYQQEYEDLAGRLKSEPEAEQQFKGQLGDIAEMLEVLRSGQRAIHDDQRAIRSDLIDMRQVLLNHYDASEREIIASITEKLNDNQIALTQVLLDGVNSNQLSDIEMREMLSDLKEHLSSLPDRETDAVFEILNSPEVDFKHRLKVAIPLIPRLLPFLPSVDYEGELELGTGFNAKATWEKLKDRLRGK